MNDNNKNIITKEELVELLGDNWSNAACCGYVIKTCENIGLSSKETKEIITQIKLLFDKYTVDEAKNIFYRF